MIKDDEKESRPPINDFNLLHQADIQVLTFLGNSIFYAITEIPQNCALIAMLGASVPHDDWFKGELKEALFNRSNKILNYLIT